MQRTTLPFENWAVRWATSARRAPEGRLLAGFLVDLVADTMRLRQASTVCFPLEAAARALGVGPTRLSSALQCLAEAGLLTWRADGAPDAPDVTVTLLLPAVEEDVARVTAVGAAPAFGPAVRFDAPLRPTVPALAADLPADATG
ncbi:hypothetical protein ACH41H_30140 [Streptomyces sp. NPDC020800]|uniref:hypothetical protein n=1 Tax=Streptomyces sp. NPDC020800 TaxID=3365092 RepID=UPI0037A690E9